MKHNGFGNSDTFRLCPDCGNSFPRTAVRCPKCGYEPATEGKRAGLHYKTERGDNMGAYGSPELHPNFKEQHPRTNNWHFPRLSKKLTDYIPGFRSGVIWHMILAGLYYLISVCLVFSTSTYPLYIKLMQLSGLVSVAYFAAIIPKPPIGMNRSIYAAIGVVLILVGYVSIDRAKTAPGGRTAGIWVSNNLYPIAINQKTNNYGCYEPGTYEFNAIGFGKDVPTYYIYVSQEPLKELSTTPTFSIGGESAATGYKYDLPDKGFVYIWKKPTAIQKIGAVTLRRISN